MHKRKGRRLPPLSLTDSLKHVLNNPKTLVQRTSLSFSPVSIFPAIHLPSPLECFKGAKFSPDGTCVLTALNRQCLIYEPAVLTHATVTVGEGEPIYAYSWYPGMNSQQAETCCFATVCKNTPIHLWDAYHSNQLRASYQLKTQMLEPVWALSVELTSTRVFAGLDNFVYSWDISIPGLPLERIPAVVRGGRRKRGMVSCMDFNSRQGLGAFGTYSGYVLLNNMDSSNTGEMESEVLVFACGVSQVKFSPIKDFYLFVSGRRSVEIICLDVRQTSHQAVVQRFPRSCVNNQKLEFDLCGSLIAFGDGAGGLQVWDTDDSSGPVGQIDLGLGVVNGVSFNPSTLTQLKEIAITTGTRPKPQLVLSDSEGEEEEVSVPSGVMVWSYH
ncbi:hypothetical protein BASA81_017560 [Batrachochytrium salamandrivorans]|nr:hypothetical protein BASA81_017560 [Batrachochytrium salamandrivorans]